MGVTNSNVIKNEFLRQGLNSKIAGIREKAKQGTGNYSFKSAKAINEIQAKEMTPFKVITRNGNTLVEGELNGKQVFYANKSDDKTILGLLKKREKRGGISKSNPETAYTTTTYDRWRKKNKSNFDAWWFGNKKAK